MPKGMNLTQAVAKWLFSLVPQFKVLLGFEPFLVSALVPLTHLLLGEIRAQAILKFMAIKATRSKTVAVFMLYLAGLNSQNDL